MIGSKETFFSSRKWQKFSWSIFEPTWIALVIVQLPHLIYYQLFSTESSLECSDFQEELPQSFTKSSSSSPPRSPIQEMVPRLVIEVTLFRYSRLRKFQRPFRRLTEGPLHPSQAWYCNWYYRSHHLDQGLRRPVISYLKRTWWSDGYKQLDRSTVRTCSRLRSL